IGAEDSLKYFPNLDVRKRFIGDRSSPVATHTTGSGSGARALIYADEVLLSNLLGSDNTLYTPRWGMAAPEEIARIDVIYGPLSALYSGNAMGAVVVFTTRQPDGYLVFDARLNYRVNRHANLGLGVDNLTNELYFQ